MKAPDASGSSGNSRRMNFALPESTYFALTSGQTSLWKAAQWLQVSEAYSMMVAGASALPSTMSGKAWGASSAAVSAGVSGSAPAGDVTALTGAGATDDKTARSPAARPACRRRRGRKDMKRLRGGGDGPDRIARARAPQLGGLRRVPSTWKSPPSGLRRRRRRRGDDGKGLPR